jgi:hypothetical protein
MRVIPISISIAIAISISIKIEIRIEVVPTLTSIDIHSNLQCLSFIFYNIAFEYEA